MRKRVGIPFEAGSERTRDAARRGGKATAISRRKITRPYTGTILDAMHAAGMVGKSWAVWEALLKLTFGLPLTDDDWTIVERYTGRKLRTVGARLTMYNEVWCIIGRGGGKSRIAALIALYMAISFDMKTVAPGEPVVVPILAASVRQSGVVFRYLRALCGLPAFTPYIFDMFKRTVHLHSGLSVEVMAARSETLRGFTLPCVVADEIAFWETDSDAAQSDEDIVDAIRPGLDRVDNSLLIGISSPYARRGMLHTVHEEYFGVSDPHVLVWKADTRSMNPTFAQWRIEKRFKGDAVKAGSEYGRDGEIVFRSDVESYVSVEVLRACTVPDRFELPYDAAHPFHAFVDLSGGGADSMALALGYLDKGTDRAVVALVREIEPPQSRNTDNVVMTFAKICHAYRVTTVIGDAYGGQWPRQSFRNFGIDYETSTLSKSDLFREVLPALNSGKIALLDLARLRHQFLILERRVGRVGRDTIGKPKGSHDDLCNVVAGLMYHVLPQAGKQKQQLIRIAPGIWGRGIPKPTALTPAPDMHTAMQERIRVFNEKLDRQYAAMDALPPVVQWHRPK